MILRVYVVKLDCSGMVGTIYVEDRQTLLYTKYMYIHFFCLIWFFASQSTIFQLCWDRSSWVEPVLSLAQGHKSDADKARTPGLKSNTPPLSHCAPVYISCGPHGYRIFFLVFPIICLSYWSPEAWPDFIKGIYVRDH